MKNKRTGSSEEAEEDGKSEEADEDGQQ